MKIDALKKAMKLNDLMFYFCFPNKTSVKPQDIDNLLKSANLNDKDLNKKTALIYAANYNEGNRLSLTNSQIDYLIDKSEVSHLDGNNSSAAMYLLFSKSGCHFTHSQFLNILEKSDLITPDHSGINILFCFILNYKLTPFASNLSNFQYVIEKIGKLDTQSDIDNLSQKDFNNLFTEAKTHINVFSIIESSEVFKSIIKKNYEGYVVYKSIKENIFLNNNCQKNENANKKISTKKFLKIPAKISGSKKI